MSSHMCDIGAETVTMNGFAAKVLLCHLDMDPHAITYPPAASIATGLVL